MLPTFIAKIPQKISNFSPPAMTSPTKLEVLEDQTQEKWRVPLREDVFGRFLSQGSPPVHKVFGDGSLFSPLLFGKFFDPSDAFPLWDFESHILLSNLRIPPGQSFVDWFQTDQDYVLKTELPGVGKNSFRVCVEKGRVLEISGQWKMHKESNNTKDWRSGHWWEHGYVRRLELPENADWRNIEAYVKNDIFLEIKVHKNSLDCDGPSRNDMAIKDSESA